MAQLIVKKNGTEIQRLSLESGNEYFAGRSADAQIPLGNERGISRQHLKFFERDGVWICESLSKFVLLQRGQDAISIVELSESTAFSLPPYEFIFSPQKEATDDSVDSGNLPTVYRPGPRPQSAASSAVAVPSHLNPNSDTDEGTSPGVNSEATMAGVAQVLVPYLRISFQNTADDEVVKLEGQLWVAGRELDCEIPIESPHVSRKHFELAKTQEGFFVTDLGSSNGTSINGRQLVPHEPAKIESGDEIEIKSVRIIFEIRDLNFEQAISHLPAIAQAPQQELYPVQWYPQGYDPNFVQQPSPEPEALPKTPLEKLKALGPKKLVVRGALISLIVVMGVALMKPKVEKPSGERNPATNPSGATSVSFDKLTQEQRNVVKDSFALARNLYVQGKYELCLTELAKLHELIPLYETSKELQSFCEQGRELVNRQRDLERKEKEKALIEQQIVGHIESCKSKLGTSSSVDETRLCLAEAIELDPEHHLIVEMIHSAQMREEEQKFMSEQRQAESAKMRKGNEHYGRAKELHKKGQLAKAITEYEKFISTPYPRLENQKNMAKRELASIRSELKTKVDFLLDQCKTLGSKNQYRDAYLSCDQALQENGGVGEAQKLKNDMLSELKRELRSIYEDSVLEESLGNVDAAKEKWKRIVKEDIPNGDYAAKAKGKLQKYVGGSP